MAKIMPSPPSGLVLLLAPPMKLPPTVTLLIVPNSATRRAVPSPDPARMPPEMETAPRLPSAAISPPTSPEPPIREPITVDEPIVISPTSPAVRMRPEA
jgi:hypothetical protein